MTLMKRAAGLLLATIPFFGCAVGPDYVAPKTELTAFHNLDAVARRHTTTPAPQLDRWWTGFNDPVQKLDLVAIALRLLPLARMLSLGLARCVNFVASTNSSRLPASSSPRISSDCPN